MSTVAIVGSRCYPNLEQVRAFVRSLPEGTVVLSGSARGVDHAAVKEAERIGLRTVVIRPAYDMHGRLAPLVRNEAIAEQCDLMVAFWDGTSPGTRHVINHAVSLRKHVTTLRPSDYKPAEDTNAKSE